MWNGCVELRGTRIEPVIFRVFLGKTFYMVQAGHPDVALFCEPCATILISRDPITYGATIIFSEEIDLKTHLVDKTNFIFS